MYKRRAILGFPLAAVTSQLAAATGRSKALQLDLTKPADNVYAIVKLQGDVSGKTVYPWSTGHVFGVIENEMAVPLLRYESCRVGEYHRRNDDAIEFRYRGMIFYQDYETGEFIDEFRNPLTNEVRSVQHYRTSIGRYAYTENGMEAAIEFKGETGVPHRRPYLLPWVQRGDHIFVTLDERVKYQRPSDGAIRVDNAQLRYEGLMSELADPELSSASCSTSWQTQLNWFTWLGMDDRPGMIMQGGHGRKLTHADQLSERFVRFAERTFPGVIHDPIDWND